MNNKGDPGKEVRKRIKDCMATLSKLHIFLQLRYHTVTESTNI